MVMPVNSHFHYPRIGDKFWDRAVFLEETLYGKPAQPNGKIRHVDRAEKEIIGIVKRGNLPIVVGGTGFYADALLGNQLPEVPPNPTLRKSLSNKTAPQLFAMLKKLDPARAKTIDSGMPSGNVSLGATRSVPNRNPQYW